MNANWKVAFEDVFCVPTSMWTEVSSGCSWRSVLQGGAVPAFCCDYESGVWWDQLRLLTGKELST